MGGCCRSLLLASKGGFAPPTCQRFLPVSPHLTHLKIGVIGSLALPLAGKRPPSTIVCFPPEDAFDECAPPHFWIIGVSPETSRGHWGTSPYNRTWVVAPHLKSGAG